MKCHIHTTIFQTHWASSQVCVLCHTVKTLLYHDVGKICSVPLAAESAETSSKACCNALCIIAFTQSTQLQCLRQEHHPAQQPCMQSVWGPCATLNLLLTVQSDCHSMLILLFTKVAGCTHPEAFLLVNLPSNAQCIVDRNCSLL